MTTAAHRGPSARAARAGVRLLVVGALTGVVAGCGVAGGPPGQPVAAQSPAAAPTWETVAASPTPTTQAAPVTPGPTLEPSRGGSAVLDGQGPAAGAPGDQGVSAAPAASAGPAAPAAPAASGRALAGRTIVIDPGHNGGASAAFNNRRVPAGNGRVKACNTSGTASRSGLGEHTVNFRLAQALRARLTAQGAKVVLTRTTDTGAGPCVDERGAAGKKYAADVVVSLHADGNESSGARGFHVIRSTTMIGGPAVEASSQRLATLVVEEFARTGMPRSTYTGGGQAITARDDIAGLNLSAVPAVMLEAGNMHHPLDADLLADPAFVAKEVDALSRAVTRWMASR